MEELKTSTWSDGSEDDLVRELLDDESPFLVAPHEMMIMSQYNSSPSNESAINQFVSVEPTIDDIDNGLPVTNCKHKLHPDMKPARISILEKGWSKVENKYTLKIKSCGGSGMSDDGYKWRKYGQKFIKNSPFPRISRDELYEYWSQVTDQSFDSRLQIFFDMSYYRCTNPGCSAKKQVEQSIEDPDTLIITYEGLHLHYAFPYFLLNQSQHVDPPSKKLKSVISKGEAQAQAKAQAKAHEMVLPMKGDKEAETNLSSASPSHGPFVVDCMQAWSIEEGMGPQGLLEDMVPSMIRNPSNNQYFSSNSSSSSSYPSPPTSPSSLSWSPNYYSPCFNVGL
ncbi:unnamed protein product [Camellia sinensis]